MAGRTDDALNIIIDKANVCFNQATHVFWVTEFYPRNVQPKQRGKAAGTAHLQKNETALNAFLYQQIQKEVLSHSSSP